jgi:enoyl-CoA hydratase
MRRFRGFHLEGPVLYLDQPESQNRLSCALLEDLRALLTEWQQAPPKLLILTSSQSGVFSAGADLLELRGLQPEQARQFSQLGQTVMELLETLPCPVWALVDGPCYGGAFDLALACRHIQASGRARFCHPGVKRGILTGFGGTVRLVERLGLARATLVLATGMVLTSECARDWGLLESKLPIPYDHLRADWPEMC